MAGNDVVRLTDPTGRKPLFTIPWEDEVWPPPEYLVVSAGFDNNMISVERGNPNLPTLLTLLAELKDLPQVTMTWFERKRFSKLEQPGSNEDHFCRGAEYWALTEPPQLIQ